MPRLIHSVLALSLVVINPTPVLAIDWIGIQTQQNYENNLRRHQQEMASPRRNERRPGETRSRSTRHGQSPAMSARAERQARAEGQRIMDSHRPRLEREHRRRIARDGKASADRWLKAEAFAIGQKVGSQMKAKYAGR